MEIWVIEFHAGKEWKLHKAYLFKIDADEAIEYLEDAYLDRCWRMRRYVPEGE